MPISNYPKGFAHGVNVRGMPVLNSYPGSVFWVDSGAGSDNNRGTFDRPLATIDQAVTLCTASNGDIIMLKPGHAENLSGATTFQLDKAGIAVIGLGAGSLRPTFTYTGTAGSVEMDSADCTIQNVKFLASVSAVVVGINVDADNCALLDCEFDFDATGDDFLIHVDCQDVSGTIIQGCRFLAELTAGSNEAVRMDNADRIRIVGNYFFGDFANAAIWSDTSGDTGDGSTVSDDVAILHNAIYQGDTSIGTAIDLNNADTGIIAYNSLTAPAGLGVAATLDPGSCMCIENYAVTAVDNTGAVVPQTADT